MSKQLAYYGGVLFLLLVVAYFVRSPLMGAYTYGTRLYDDAADVIGKTAFDNYEVPDNYYRP